MLRILCPYCQSDKFGKVDMEPGQKIALVIRESDGNIMNTCKPVDAYGCSNCGFIALRDLDVRPSPR